MADDFQPDIVQAKDDFQPDDFTPDTPTSRPEGFWKGLAMSIPRQAVAGYEQYKSASQPDVGVLGSMGRSAGGLLQMATLPFAPGTYTGGKLGRAVYSSDAWTTDLTDAALSERLALAKRDEPGAAPMYEALLAIPYEERLKRSAEAGQYIGEIAGGSVGPFAVARGVSRLVRGALPARMVAPVPTPPPDIVPVPTPPQRLALPPMTGPSVVGPARTFEVGQPGVELLDAERNLIRQPIQPGAVLGRTPETRVGVGPRTMYEGEMPTQAEIAAARSTLAGVTTRPVPPTVTQLPDLSIRGVGEPGQLPGQAAPVGHVPIGPPTAEELAREPFTGFGGTPTTPTPPAPTPPAPTPPAPHPPIAGGAGPEVARVAAASQTFLDKVRAIVSPENIAVLKTKMEVPSLFGFPPSDISRVSPSATKLVEKMQDRSVVVNNIHRDLVQTVSRIVAPLADEASLLHVTKLLDTEGGAALAARALAPTELRAYTQLRTLFNDLAEAMGMGPDKRITDYFPHLREVLGIEGRKIISVPRKEVPVYIQDVTPKRIVKEFFEKDRTLMAPASDLGLNPVLAYMRGASRRIGYGGGRNPVTGETLTSILQDIQPEISQIPERLTKYFTTYVNDVIGVSRATGTPGISYQASGRLKGLEFGRTIVGNIASPIGNLTQLLLNAADVNPVNFVRGLAQLRKMRDPVEVARLRKLGVIDQLSATDHDFINSISGDNFDKFMHTWNQKGGSVFQWTENVNRAGSYYMGKLEAASRGITDPAEIERFAVNQVRKSQFLFGKEDLPQGFRDPLSEHMLVALGQTSARQFKNFPIKYTMAVKNMVMDDIHNIPTFTKASANIVTSLGKGDVGAARDALQAAYNAAPSKFSKFALVTGGLFGSDAITMGMDRMFTGEEKFWQTRGLVGYLGVAFGHQVGLNIIPAEDLNSLLFFLPGPLISHFLDAASASASLASTAVVPGGKDIDFTFSRNNMLVQTSLGPMNPEKVAAQFTRSIPLAGVPLNRGRTALMHARAEDPTMVRTPMNLSQAFGVTPIPRGAPIGPKGLARGNQLEEAVQQIIGLQGSRSAAEQQFNNLLANATDADNKTIHRAAQLLVAGQGEDAAALLRARGVILTPGAMANAAKGSVFERALANALKAGKLRRGPGLDLLNRAPGGLAGQE